MFWMILFGALAQAENEQQSIIRTSVSIDLQPIEQRLNQLVPHTIENISESGRTCINAQWLKTKGIPSCKLRGIKLYCKDTWLKTKTTPEVKCDVTGWVKRNGPISISSSGNKVFLNVPVKAQVEAQGRGEIGKNIQQTASAEASFTFDATLSVDESWQVKADVNAGYRWTKRPELKLFNLIPITIGGKVDPNIRQQLAEFAISAEKELSQLDLRSSIDSTWHQIQVPSGKSNTGLNARFRPTGVSYSGFQSSGQILETVIHIEGFAEARDSLSSAHKPVPLLPLKKTSSTEKGSEVIISMVVSENTVSTLANEYSKKHGWLVLNREDDSVNGRVKFQDVEITLADQTMSASMDAVFDDQEGFFDSFSIFSFFMDRERIVVSGKPKLDPNANVLYFDCESIQIIRDNQAGENQDVFSWILNSNPVRQYLCESMSYDFADDIRNNVEALTGTTKSQRGTLFTSIESVSVGALKVSQGLISLPIMVTGVADVEVKSITHTGKSD